MGRAPALAVSRGRFGEQSRGASRPPRRPQAAVAGIELFGFGEPAFGLLPAAVGQGDLGEQDRHVRFFLEDVEGPQRLLGFARPAEAQHQLGVGVEHAVVARRGGRRLAEVACRPDRAGRRPSRRWPRSGRWPPPPGLWDRPGLRRGRRHPRAGAAEIAERLQLGPLLVAHLLLAGAEIRPGAEPCSSRAKSGRPASRRGAGARPDRGWGLRGIVGEVVGSRGAGRGSPSCAGCAGRRGAPSRSRGRATGSRGRPPAPLSAGLADLASRRRAARHRRRRAARAGRQQVGARDHPAVDQAAAERPRRRDDQRHPHGGVVDELAVGQLAMVAEAFAMSPIATTRVLASRPLASSAASTRPSSRSTRAISPS